VTTLGCLAAVPSAPAADQLLRGDAFAIRDPVPGAPEHRTLRVKAASAAGADPISGDPTTPAESAGGVLTIALGGTVPATQTFVLPQGAGQAGPGFWRPLQPGGYAYVDRDGVRGPVRLLSLRRGARGNVRVRMTLRGTMALAPPNLGTDATMTIALTTGERYCIRFAGDGIVRNRGAEAFSIRHATTTACPTLASGTFLALNYNVAGLPQGISSSNPVVNTPIIGPLLNGYDIVLMQETWKTPDPNPLAPTRVYHEILEAASLHPFKSRSMLQPLGTDPRRPSAFLADGLDTFSRFPFGEITREMWAGCDNSAADCLALKGFSMVRMTVAPGVTVDVYDLHMEAGGTANDDALRDAGVTQLSTFIQSHSAGRPLLVAGDFNLHTDTEPDATQYARLLAETGLSDVCDTVGCPDPGAIEKVAFRSGGAVTLAPLSWRFEDDVFVRDGNVPLSDHPALAVRFGWSLPN
jgi:hypothetical protein